jgi:MFS family permease
MSRRFRWANGAMLALFLLGVVVQYNDPDPIPWMAIYGAAFAVCVMVALGRRLPMAVPIAVGFVALAWSLLTIVGGPAAGLYAHMFDAWEMKSMPVEEAREGTGLLIVGAWMFVVAMRQRRRSGGA